MTVPAPPFAVHIADGYLVHSWEIGGYVLMVAGIALSLWRISDREVPRVGVLAAALFVSSQGHIPFGAFTVHLLLNGLAGVILRHRVPLAIAVGLTLQTLLFAHGGWGSLGVNFVVLTAPAVLAGVGYRPLARRMSPFVGGLMLGLVTAAVTVLLHASILYFGSVEQKGYVAGISLVAHLPVIVIEGVGVGFACRVLAKAKPEWLGASTPPRDDGR